MRHHAGWLKTCSLKFNRNDCGKNLVQHHLLQLCTHVLVTALLVSKMTSASSVMSPVDLKVSTTMLRI